MVLEVKDGVVILQEFSSKHPVIIAAIARVVRMKQETALVRLVFTFLYEVGDWQIEVFAANEQLDWLKRCQASLLALALVKTKFSSVRRRLALNTISHESF